jgi:hypothetical protein
MPLDRIRGEQVMIADRSEKINEIVRTIRARSSEINERYRKGPSLYFYRKVMSLRTVSEDIEHFLADDYNTEILYATLVAWDMNSRGAKMKYYDEFKKSIVDCLEHLRELQSFQNNRDWTSEEMIPHLMRAYQNMHLMRSQKKLVSNSKCFHFLFPNMLMPADGTNTLTYFYGTTNESVYRYIELTKLSHEIMNMPEQWEQYLDDEWNTTVPKMIDNAIILIRGKSVK